MDKLPETVSPPGLYIFAIEQLLEDIQKGILAGDSEKVFLAARFFMESKQLSNNDKRMLWLLLCACRPVLQEFVNRAVPLLNRIAEEYPYDRINDISDVYLPPEQFCLQYLDDDPLKFNTKTLRSLKPIFEKHRYFNCEMVVALFEAVLDGKQIHLRDILHGLLRQIVNRAFDYRLESKAEIVNYIFPRCISETGSSRFAIKNCDMIFCEGVRAIRKDGTVYMRCRNCKCHERTEYLNQARGCQPDCSFFEILRSVLGFSPDKIFEDEDCSLAMGSFNRWNEIAERLVCGYPNGQGCGSPLTFDSANKGRPGWQAYATTYWHCSNGDCDKQKSIKLSHCKGCRKIIDSRIDIYSCPRNGEIRFYVCKNCGYCCEQHGVSGICPHCGNISLRRDDPYGSIYRCENEKCGQVVKTPLWLPEAMKNTLRNNQKGDGKQISLEPPYLDDDIPSDDIPF